MRYFIIIIIIFCLFFSILFLNSCKIKGFTESLDSEEIQEEIPEPDQDPEKTADEDDDMVFRYRDRIQEIPWKTRKKHQVPY